MDETGHTKSPLRDLLSPKINTIDEATGIVIMDKNLFPAVHSYEIFDINAVYRLSTETQLLVDASFPIPPQHPFEFTKP